MLSPATAVEAATIAVGTGAKRFCMVASGRARAHPKLRRFIAAVGAVKSAHPDLEICACLGLLSDGQCEQLKEAGVFAYNHNLNTSQDHYGKICSTHDFADREQTVRRAKSSGLSPCSGALFGMGETDEDIVAGVTVDQYGIRHGVRPNSHLGRPICSTYSVGVRWGAGNYSMRTLAALEQLQGRRGGPGWPRPLLRSRRRATP